MDEATGPKIDRLLQTIRDTPYGPSRIANLSDGLSAQHINVDQFRELINTLPDMPREASKAYADFSDHIEKWTEIYFQRPSPPSWDRPIALVLYMELFDQQTQFHLFSEQYIAKAKSLGTAPSPLLPIWEAEDLDDSLRYIREGLVRGLAKGLGAPGRVVFVTPVDENWETLTSNRFSEDERSYAHPGCADDVCNQLGLPYRNTWLVELRSTLKLSEMVKQGQLRLAAPTVIEAWRHNYFRHWPREAASDRWGRTLFIGDGNVDETKGLPEAIVDGISPGLLSEAFEVAILGKVTAREIPQHDAIDACMIQKRDIDALLKELVARIAS